MRDEPPGMAELTVSSVLPLVTQSFMGGFGGVFVSSGDGHVGSAAASPVKFLRMFSITRGSRRVGPRVGTGCVLMGPFRLVLLVLRVLGGCVSGWQRSGVIRSRKVVNLCCDVRAR